MRIVAGLARGRRLVGPGEGTRPTSDRAREGLFNSLTTLLDLPNARVLDLFAGTGAVGLEALSRGAAEAVFVESDRAACRVLARNVEGVALPGARIVTADVAAHLAGTPSAAFDLVFADPPYALSDDDLRGVLARLVAGGWLARDAVVVLERSARGTGPPWPHELEPLRHKRYGEGVLWYGRRR